MRRLIDLLKSWLDLLLATIEHIIQDVLGLIQRVAALSIRVLVAYALYTLFVGSGFEKLLEALS
jgi:hypothetical protein